MIRKNLRVSAADGTAGSVGFSWFAIGSKRAKSVVVENLELWLHPGKETPLDAAAAD